MRKVQFADVDGSVGDLNVDKASEEEATVELTDLQKMLEQSVTGKTVGEQQETDAKAHRREEARSKAHQLAKEQQRQRQRLTYEKDVRAAREEAEHEYWNGQRIPRDHAIAAKVINIRRQNSHEGRRPEQLLVSGEAFKPLFKPYREQIEDEKREQEGSSQRDRDSEIGNRTKLRSTTLDRRRIAAMHQQKRRGAGQPGEPDMIRWGRQSMVK